MPGFKDKFKKISKSNLQVMVILLVIFFAIILLWFNNSVSVQSTPALVAQVRFYGEYRIGDGPWQEIVEGEHIPSTEGDVTLRGNLHMLAPDGEYVGVYRGDVPVAFYTDHINLTFYEVGMDPYVCDMENPQYGSSMCGVNWVAATFMGDSEDEIRILIRNPHTFGNEAAIDEMISSIQFWTGADFEKEVLNEGEPQRNAGMLLMLVSIVFLGIALFSTLIHVKSSGIIWLLGFVVLFAGTYIVYSAHGVSFWSESIVSNTTVLGVSMIFYMLFLSMTIACVLKTSQKLADFTVVMLSLINVVFLVIPIATDVRFYDTWMCWAAVQLVANIVLIICLACDFVAVKTKIRWLYLGAILPLIAFCVDAVGTWCGAWEGGLVSRHVFAVLFAAAMIMVLKFIPGNINAAAKARELELEKITLNAQLTESRVSTMMSQIRPHFIYNTLGSIEQLCKIDPPKAADLVHNFAKYLRGNFGELDNPKPILMSQEMEHVHHYVSIENVRFPDMTFTFEMECEDFYIPALTVQPIVENAIKHGLMKLPRGGTINVISYETDTDYIISVEDDGVGFDTGALIDERKHVGLRNIRERLKVMVNGTLDIESTVGVGTKVLITIPKEVRK